MHLRLVKPPKPMLFRTRKGKEFELTLADAQGYGPELLQGWQVQIDGQWHCASRLAELDVEFEATGVSIDSE